MRPVNLIPEAQRRRPAGSQSGSSWIVLGVLGTLLMMTAGYVLTSNQVTSRTNDTAAASAEADQLEARAAELGGFGNFAAVKETRVASVRQIAASRFDWERLIRELSRVLPDGSWLQMVEASAAGDSSDGGSGDSSAASGPAATLTGCVPRQPDAAALLLRLQRMHRVADVLLKESTRETGGGAATLDNCGRLYQFDVEVTFDAAPVSEAPAGETRVPASLGGGS